MGELSALRFADGTRARGGMDQRTHRALLRGIAPPTSRPLDDLGPLRLRDDSLDLHQELVFRGLLALLAVENHHAHAHAAELVAHERVVRLLARQAIRAIRARHVEQLDPASSGEIPHAFQGRTDERRSAVARIAVARINEREDARGPGCLAGTAFPQRRDLTVDALGVGLPVRGDPRRQPYRQRRGDEPR